MNAVDTFHQRLREEIATVEKEIQSHNQQVEALTQRLEGLKRADELFDSDQAAIAELLQAGVTDGSATTREMATVPAAIMQRAAARPTVTEVKKPSGRSTQITQGKTGRAQKPHTAVAVTGTPGST
jgi:chromosome segregation ATPase